MTQHRKIRITGLVQGVFFRACTVKAAQTYGITGWVRNEPDGSVYVEAEGKEADMRKFIEWCWIGSEMAKVKNVDVTIGEVLGYTDFKVR